MRNCIDEGTLQAWFDGELPATQAASVTSHLNSCEQCKRAARELEEENSLVNQALTEEFARAVPTELLQHRINKTVDELETNPQTAGRDSGFSATIRSLFGSMRPRTLAYASMIVVAILIAAVAVTYLRKNTATPEVARTSAPGTKAPAAQPSPEIVTGYQPVVAAPGSRTEHKPEALRVRTVKTKGSQPTELAQRERSYEQTIARLNAAIQTRTMRPTLQVDYERNLAVVNQAIASTREAARKDPKNPQAAEFVYAAYQSKVDFLNQIADARTAEK